MEESWAEETGGLRVVTNQVTLANAAGGTLVFFKAHLYTSSAFGGEILQAIGAGPAEEDAAANAYQLFLSKRLEGPPDA